jgi:hypothetical protein
MSLFDRVKAMLGSKAVQPCPLAADGTLVVQLHRRDGGAPVANANVTVRGPTPGAGVTDGQGSLILPGRSPGQYDATITLAPELALQNVRLVAGALSDSVPAGGVAILVAEAVGTGHLEIEVVDETRALVTDDIVIRASGAQALGQTSKTGTHAFRDIAVGKYTASATVPASKYETPTVRQPVVVVQGETARVRLYVKKQPKIVSVAFLDGDDAIEVASATQFVNLARAPASVDGAVVANLDRSGHRPRIKVRFDKPGSHQFSIKLLPQSSNAPYTGTETARNARFLYQKDQKSYTTDGEGSKILPLDDFYVSAAGKDKYRLEARDDNGISVRTGDLEVQRLVYYVEIKMRSLTTVATSLATLEAEYAKHNIKLLKLPAVEMDHMPNVGAQDSATFMKLARAAYAGSQAVAKQPYAVAIAYTGHLAVKNPNQLVLKTGLAVGPGKPPVDIPIVAAGLTSGVAQRYLWQGLVPGEGWFVSAKFIKDGGSAADEVDLPEARCVAVPESAGSPERANMVRIDVTALTAGTGTIELRVHVVDRMRAGLSFAGGNLICVCTKSWWKTKDTAAQNQVMVHELGHTFGMVANGSAKGPDKTVSWYDNSKGHVGDHCFHGNAAGQARYDAKSDSAKSKCVMYGATNGISAFCADCAPALRKVDLSAGWSAF